MLSVAVTTELRFTAHAKQTQTATMRLSFVSLRNMVLM
jgi:hypothetical protein